MTHGRSEVGGLTIQRQEGGPTLITTSAPLIERDGLWFKDAARAGALVPYCDWRLDADARARDLAARLSVEQLAGLMLYSPHQMVPSLPGEPFAATYGGRPFPEAGCPTWELSDQQRRMLADDHIRHVLVLKLADADTAARWNNALQALAESLPWGIPVNTSSDPRHGAAGGAEFKSAAVDVSRWPEGLGMAALFSPDAVRAFAAVAAREYRALGITTALGPQIDLGTEPRWMRLEDTWGPHPRLVTDYARAYCDGLQTSDTPDGWGADSVAAMVKHWPGGGTGEGGRDAHYAFGAYAVYPGENAPAHLEPFVAGAFDLAGPTGAAAAVMPYYTVSTAYPQPPGGGVGNSYNRYLIADLLRGEHGYDGVVCTDWGITADPAATMDSFGSRCFGVADLTEAERHLLAIDNGVDQFGGNSAMGPVLAAYRLGAERDGEAATRARFEASAVRLLRTFFRCGLFENPYLVPADSAAVVGNADFVAAGYAAQRRSLVLLKNRGGAPLASGMRIWVPGCTRTARKGFFRTDLPAAAFDPVDADALAGRLVRVDDPADADAAVVFIESPLSDGFSSADLEAGGTGYVPISLQYRPYVASTAREPSLAGGDFREASADRSYRGKTGTCANESDLDHVLAARAAMGARPVIVVLRLHNPPVPGEFEPAADTILVDLGVQQRAVWDVLLGEHEPSGLLPVALPASMAAVEAHCEDVPFDYACHVDAAGNAYDVGFGLDFAGVIADERTRRYGREDRAAPAASG
jgi:beta-glucosidase